MREIEAALAALSNAGRIIARKKDYADGFQIMVTFFEFYGNIPMVSVSDIGIHITDGGDLVSSDIRHVVMDTEPNMKR